MSDSEPKEPQEKPEAPEGERFALVVKVQSWATPIIGLVMLVIGLLAGYFFRPAVNVPSATAAPTAVAQVTAASPTQDPAAAQELMKYLLGQAKHFEGDANAPVTLIEFSDFQ